MREFQEELTEAVANLDRHFSDLKVMARQRLGSLYNARDYPESLRGMFSVEFDLPSVEPQELHSNRGLQHVATEMSRVQSVLDGLLVDRPRRNILRRPRSRAGAQPFSIAFVSAPAVQIRQRTSTPSGT